MREIKFRAWDHEKNIYGDVTLIERYIGEHEQAKNYGHKGRVSLWNPKNLDDCGSWGRWIERVDLEQFTGLRDKSGVKIYEGDILSNGIDGKKWFVRWSCKGEYTGFVADENGTNRCAFLLNDEYKNAEVIGNIHEKPEEGR